MLVHPQFDPVALYLGPFGIHWYGLMYLLGFVAFIWLGRKRVHNLRANPLPTPSSASGQRGKLKKPPLVKQLAIRLSPQAGKSLVIPGGEGAVAVWDKKFLDDLLFYGVLGVVLGGRLGEVLFYQPGYYFSHPLKILAVWEGGMSFHGGFLGVLVAMALFARARNIRWLALMDFIAPLVPPGLAFGRLGNFINGELWGRPTDLPWGMVFPRVDSLPRHPSQLYEFALEGVALFILLWWFSSKQRPVGAVSGLFLIGYGCFRFLGEFTRNPDDGIFGLMTFGVSMGQWLSLPMLLAGGWLIRRAYQRPRA